MKSYFYYCILTLATFIFSCGNSDEAGTRDYTKVEDSIQTNITVVPDEETNRVLWQKPNTVLQELGDLSDKVVADLGAGTGFFSFRMLPRAEKVIALEIDTTVISFMEKTKERLPENFKERLEIRLVKSDDPGLEAEEVDIILIVNTVAYLSNRSVYFQKLKAALKQEGKIVIIDFKKNQTFVGPDDNYKLEYRQVVEQLKNAGFDDIGVDNSTLDYQYIITAINQP